MRTSGRSIAGRLGPAFVLFATFAVAALAAETWVAAVPAGNAYVVTAVLAPGPAGAEVCGDVTGQDHVDFRVGFGPDLKLSVNGADAGTFVPCATYRVTIVCQRIGCQWFATTSVLNQTTGLLVFQQMNYAMPGAAEEVRAVAEDVILLCVQ